MNSEEDDRTVIRPRSAARTGMPSPSAEPVTEQQPTLVQTQAASAPAAPAAPQHHAITLPAGTRLGEFEVQSTIGEGGFGIVYLAWDHSLDRKVALKEYMPSSIAFRAGQSEIKARSERHQDTFDAGMKSFINEAKLLAQFDHPSLLKVYRFWEANGTAYMVMPFLEGATVKDTVRAMPAPPDEAWIVSLVKPVCDALAMLHAVQIYHRDIAPDNILLMADTGRPLLLDFGAARRVIGDMTQALTAILKPGYAPVEQYADMPGLKQGPWTDVYALAAVVHWMILGKTPSPSVGRLFDDAYVPLAQSAAGRYSDGFLQAIDRALAVMPDKRTQTVEAFRADLLGQGPHAVAATTAMRTMTAHAAVPRSSPPLPTTRRDERTRQLPTPPAPSVAVGGTTAPARKWLPVAIGAVVVAVVAVAAVLMWPKPAPTPPSVAQDAPAAAVSASSAAVAPAVGTTASPSTTPPATTPSETPTLSTTPPAVDASPTTTTSTAAPTATAPEPAIDKAPPVRTVKPKAEPKAEPKASGRERSAESATRTAEPRTSEPRAEPRTAEPAAASNRDECAKLFQRLSIGDTDQGLIDRIRALRCR